MKRLHIYVVTLFAVSWSLLEASTLTVDNNSGSTAAYQTLQSAFDAAANGDVIHLIPSTTSYGNLVYNGATNKTVKIYGNGYFLGLNPSPQTQANILTSKVTDITVSSNMSGFFISGVEIIGKTTVNGVNNATFVRNKLSISSGTAVKFTGVVSNIIFSQNYVVYGVGGNGATSFDFLTATCQMILFTNNVILATSIGNPIKVPSVGVTDFTFSNNVFISMSCQFGGANVQNNIFHTYTTYGGTVMTVTGGTNIYNNICIGTNFLNTTANNNILVTSGSSIFANWLITQTSATLTSTDNIWSIIDGSVADNSGTDGTDRGIFGGAMPYVLSGIPAIPSFYSIGLPSIIRNNQNTINVNVKIKSNN